MGAFPSLELLNSQKNSSIPVPKPSIDFTETVSFREAFTR